MSSYLPPRWSYVSCAILLIALLAVDATGQTLTFARDDYPSNPGGRGITTADFDRNGSTDIAQANLGRNAVTIVLNHMGAGFDRATEVPVAAGPFDITTSDFNRDGIPDLAVACADGNAISVLLGNGRGSFTRTDVAAASQNPRGITSADVNNDGKPDLIYTGFASRTVQVLVGNGQGIFTKGVTYVGSPANPQGLATADFNHDGRLDVALAYASSGGLRILYGNGGTAFSGRTITGTTNLNVVTTGDFNADGWDDVAAASTSGSTVSIYLGSATGLVQTQTYATGASPRGISVGDVNQDGVPDLMTANRSSSTVTVLLGDRANPGAFLPGVEVGAGTGSRAIAAADFNADGKLDLATVNEYASSTTVLSNETIFTRAAYSFSRRKLALPGDHFSQFGMHVWTADFNRDGKPDVLMARSLEDDEPIVLSVILTGGATADLPVVGYPRAVAVADVNADGNQDIVYASSHNSSLIQTFLGNGHGSFTASSPSVPAGVYVYGMIVGDLNRDARTDVVVFGPDQTDGNNVFLAMIGKGDGTFSSGARVAADYPTTFTTADVNRDAKPDLVALIGRTLSIWSGDGTGNLSPSQETIPVPESTEHFKLADVNADGYVDVVMAGGTGIDIALGGVDGFQGPVHTSAFELCGPTWGWSCWVNPDVFVLADMEGDGHLDIVTAGGDIVHGRGDGTFGPTDSFDYDAVDLAVADLTGDGIPDILYATSLGEVGLMVNERNEINRAPSVSAGPDRTLEYQDLAFVDGDRPCFGLLAIGTDPDLHRLSYEWRDRSGTLVGQSADYQFCAVPGVYEFSVTVDDNRGGTARDGVVLTVAPTREIVLHVADLADFSVNWAGNWAAVPDASAASGVRAHDPDLGAPKVTAPIPYPDGVLALTFVADPSQVYKLWVRLKADDNSWSNDSIWIQFSGAADVGGTPQYQIGSTSGLAINLEECSNCGVSGWGWEDDGWGAVNKNGVLLRFPDGGEQSLWIQTREDGVSVDQIVLSAEKYLTTRPGTAKNDRTILPATFSRK
jgi:hypothetical protein